jgi:hypothetical protein
MIDLTPLLHAVIIVIATIITTFVVPWIRGHANAKQLANATRWVEIAVKAAEQIYDGSGRGAEKLAWVNKFLSDTGFSYDDALIEAAVNDLVKTTVGSVADVENS